MYISNLHRRQRKCEGNQTTNVAGHTSTTSSCIQAMRYGKWRLILVQILSLYVSKKHFTKVFIFLEQSRFHTC